VQLGIDDRCVEAGHPGDDVSGRDTADADGVQHGESW
jgi:hypothetical protein